MMRVLVVDDSLGNLDIARQFLEELDRVSMACVVDSPIKVNLESALFDVIVLGSRWLGWAKKIRLLFPLAFIVGRCPWYDGQPFEFYPWGNELREPTVALHRLVLDRPRSQEASSEL